MIPVGPQKGLSEVDILLVLLLGLEAKRAAATEEDRF